MPQFPLPLPYDINFEKKPDKTLFKPLVCDNIAIIRNYDDFAKIVLPVKTSLPGGHSILIMIEDTESSRRVGTAQGLTLFSFSRMIRYAGSMIR